MRYDTLPYVPAGYVSITSGDVVVWSNDGSVEPAASIVVELRASIEDLLDYRLRRGLHAVLYASNDDACRALDRRLSPTALIAPLHTPELALIAMQAPSVDALNGDRSRMRRHICHELAHVFNAERTGSVKFLGDGDAGMRIAPWVDEGFAEVVAATCVERSDLVRSAVRESSSLHLSDGELDSILRDLGSPERKAAFAMATARVGRGVQRHGLRFVFERLSEPMAWRLA